MKVTYEKLIDFQIFGQMRLNTEKETKKTSRLGECIKKMLGDAGNRIKGTLTDVGTDYAEKQEDLRRDNCGTDDKGYILRDDAGRYKYTPEQDKKCALALKNLSKEQVYIEPVLCQELPTDLTDAEQAHLLGFVFTQETLGAWLQAKPATETKIITEGVTSA